MKKSLYFFLILNLFCLGISAKTPLNLTPINLNSDSSDIDFEANEINYDAEKEIIELTGYAQLNFPKEKVQISADKIIYSQKDSILTAIGNVLVNGKDQITFSDYLTLNLNDKKGELKDLNSEVLLAKINAKEAKLSETKSYKQLNYYNGSIKLKTPIRVSSAQKLNSKSKSFSFEENATTNFTEKYSEEGHQSFNIKASKVYYTPDRVQNNLLITGASLDFKYLPLTIPIPPWWYTAGASSQQMFGLTMGSTPSVGSGVLNLGPKISVVVGDPSKKRAVHVSPFLQSMNGYGIGGMLGYTDPRTDFLFAYGSAKDRFTSNFSFKFNENINFDYGWNSYKAQGGITKQFAGLEDSRNIKVPYIGQILENNSFRLENQIAFIGDSQKLRNEERNKISKWQETNIEKDKYAGRFQSKINISTKPILEIGNTNNYMGFRLTGNSIFRAYTTGDISYYPSITPNLYVHSKRLGDLETGYTQTLVMGTSPFGFDRKIEGSSSMYATGDLKIAEWLSVGGYVRHSFSKKEIVSQNIRVTVGPDDLKLLFLFDPIYRRFEIAANVLIADPVKFKRLEYREKNKKPIQTTVKKPNTTIKTKSFEKRIIENPYNKASIQNNYYKSPYL